jgi:exodeoxyribonuclease VII small subunit
MSGGHKAKAPTDEELGSLTFEQLLKRLEEVLAELEGGKLSLEDSLARFEEGMRLRALCEEKLKGVELRMEKLVKENGGLRARPLDGE